MLSIRYIGQTSVGFDRPKAHFSTETAVRSDKNQHKARWIRQVQAAGLQPEVVVLLRVPSGLSLELVTQQLNEAERSLIALYKDAGADLTNVQEGGTSGYVLTVDERAKISQARSWQSRTSSIEGVDVGVVEGSWSSERAWWLGLTFARGVVRPEPGRRSVELRTQSLELAEKWRDLCGAQRCPIRLLRDSNCWHVSQGDVRVAKWLIDAYAFHEKWETGLEWPADLPDTFAWDFVRGLWDTKGYIECKARVGRQPSARTSIESHAWPQAFVEAAVLRLGQGITFRGPANAKGQLTFGLAARGASMAPFLRRMYEGVPDAVCAVAQRERAAAACATWASVLRECVTCGVTVASGTVCPTCAKRKWDGAVCSCGRVPVVAKGLCGTCYHTAWEKQQRNWIAEATTLKRLEEYDIVGWQAAPEAEQEARLDELVATYRRNGFPWFVFEQAETDGVLAQVTVGKLTVEGESIRNVSSVGQPLCSKAHPHRQRASYRGHPSVFEAFETDKLLRRGIRFQLKQGDPVTPRRVLRALSALYKGPTNFSPVMARWIVDTYAKAGGLVFDPCAGYGGRLLGAVASAKQVRYAGLDIEARTAQGNTHLAAWVGVGDRAQVIHADALKAPWPQADLVFTGPPYYEREQYGSAADEVALRYSTLAAWADGFLGSLVRRALEAAPLVVLNVGSISLGGERMSLPDLLAVQVTKYGGSILRSWRWELHAFGATNRDERLVVFGRV